MPDPRDKNKKSTSETPKKESHSSLSESSDRLKINADDGFPPPVVSSQTADSSNEDSSSSNSSDENHGEG